MPWPWSKPKQGTQPPLFDLYRRLHRIGNQLIRRHDRQPCTRVAGRYCRILIDSGVDPTARVVITDPPSTRESHAIVATTVAHRPYWVDVLNAIHGHTWRASWGRILYTVTPRDLYRAHAYHGDGKAALPFPQETATMDP